MFERIEKLKQTYTDKYVVVDASRPELARFDGRTGLVKTVNMSGRALVQFDPEVDIGWFDIDVDFLKVVPKPEPKAPEAKKKGGEKKASAAKAASGAKPSAGKKPAATAGEKKLSPLELARMQGAAKGGTAAPAKAAESPEDSGKSSTADILAAARRPKGTTTPRSEAPSEKKAAAPASGAKPKLDRSKMSVADMLAAARAGGTSSAVTPPVEEKIEVEDEPAAEAPAAEEVPAEPAGAQKAAPPAGELPTDTDGKIAMCRQLDAK